MYCVYMLLASLYLPMMANPNPMDQGAYMDSPTFSSPSRSSCQGQTNSPWRACFVALALLLVEIRCRRAFHMVSWRPPIRPVVK